MKARVYATLGDKLETIVVKGEKEIRTVEGTKVFESDEVEELTPEWFKATYDQIQKDYPGSIVRFAKERK